MYEWVREGKEGGGGSGFQLKSRREHVPTEDGSANKKLIEDYMVTGGC